MEEENKLWEISSVEFESFRVSVRKGKLIWCSDRSHPRGTNFESLKAFYESRPYKCEVKEVKE
jgi:hypothetical protein